MYISRKFGMKIAVNEKIMRKVARVILPVCKVARVGQLPGWKVARVESCPGGRLSV